MLVKICLRVSLGFRVKQNLPWPSGKTHSNTEFLLVFHWKIMFQQLEPRINDLIDSNYIMAMLEFLVFEGYLDKNCCFVTSHLNCS